MKLYQNVCPDDISVQIWVMLGQKIRSPGQSALKPCSSSRGNSFALVFMKLKQNDSLDEISVKFEYGSHQIKN